MGYIKVCDICGKQITVGEPAKVIPARKKFILSIEKVTGSIKNTTVADICNDCDEAIMGVINDIYANNPYNPDRQSPIWHPEFVDTTVGTAVTNGREF